MLRFVHIGDTHLSPDRHYNINGASHTPLTGTRSLVKQINELPFTPDFVLHVGDVAYNSDDSAYETARAVFSDLRCPIHYLAGNHDSIAGLQHVLLGRESPRLPFDDEFEVNGVQVVCVDSNRSAPPPRGAVSAEQLDWLRRVCRPDDPRPLVVALHHNPLPVGIPWWDDFMSLTNGEEFHAALLPARDRLRGVFFGHVHQNTDTYRDGILYVSVPSAWYQIHAYPDQVETIDDRTAQPGFNVVTIDEHGTFIRRHTFVVDVDLDGELDRVP
jgi:Icc protein